MPPVNKCDILWTVVKSQQTITMKVCIEPQLPIMLSNISNLNMSSLQNYSYTPQNNTLLNISTNISDISIPASSNISNTSLNTNISYTAPSNISNTSLNTYTPSPSVIDDTQVAPSSLMSSIPIDDTQVAPSSMSLTSNFIRGSTVIDTPSSKLNLTLSPSSSVEKDNNITGIIFVMSFCIILLIVLVACFLKIRHNKQLKIPFKKQKFKNTKDRKYTSTVTPNHLIKRPKDYIIEHLNNKEQKTNRQVPRPPKEETEDHDINDTPPSE